MASKSFKMVVWCPPNGPKTPVWLPAVINDIVAQFGGFMAADCGVPVHHVKLKKGSNEVVKQIKHPQFPSAVVKRASELYHFAEGSTPRGADPKRRGSTPHFEALHHAPLPPSSPSPSLFSLSLSLSPAPLCRRTLSSAKTHPSSSPRRWTRTSPSSQSPGRKSPRSTRSSLFSRRTLSSASHVASCDSR